MDRTERLKAALAMGIPMGLVMGRFMGPPVSGKARMAMAKYEAVMSQGKAGANEGRRRKLERLEAKLNDKGTPAQRLARLEGRLAAAR